MIFSKLKLSTFVETNTISALGMVPPDPLHGRHVGVEGGEVGDPEGCLKTVPAVAAGCSSQRVGGGVHVVGAVAITTATRGRGGVDEGQEGEEEEGR